MKKILSLLILTAVILCGCKKDSNPPKPPLDDRLVTTIWKKEFQVYIPDEDRFIPAYKTFKFISTKEVEYYLERDNEILEVYGTFWYELKDTATKLYVHRPDLVTAQIYIFMSPERIVGAEGEFMKISRTTGN